MRTSTHKPQIVIVGGGVAGLLLATRLGHSMGRRGEAKVILVDHGPTHLWKPMLPTFAVAAWSVSQQQIHYLKHAHANHFDYVLGRLKSVNTARGFIRLHPLDTCSTCTSEEGEISFDELILAYGTRADDSDTPGIMQHCHFIDDHRQAEEFNTTLRKALACDQVPGKSVDIAIVGGEPVGVELAAKLSRLTDVARGNGGAANTHARLRVTLLESSQRILSAFPDQHAHAANAQLRALGVSVRTGISVAAADANGYILNDGSRVDASLRVWVAGSRAMPLNASAIEVTRAGEVVVSANLTAKGKRHIYAIGDCASFTPSGAQNTLPATAAVAIRQAQHLAKHLPRALCLAVPVPAFRLGALDWLRPFGSYGAIGSWGHATSSGAGFIKGKFVLACQAYLYRRYQLLLHGLTGACALWIAGRHKVRVQSGCELG